MAEQRIQIKRRINDPGEYAQSLSNLLDGEFGYIKETNKLFIGRDGIPTLINVNSVASLDDKNTGIVFTNNKNETYTLTPSFLPLAGGKMTGHIYLTGSKASSSTSNTSQIIFGTPETQHIAISSNNNALVINPDSATSSPQIVLYLDSQSSFPKGIKITQGNLNVSHAASIGTNLTVTGTSTLTGAVTTGAALTAGTNLTVNGTSTLKGAVTTNSTLKVGTNLTVEGTSTLKGAATTNATLSVGTNLTVNGTSTLKGAITANSTLAVTGTSTLTGAVTTGSTLKVGTNLTVEGTSTLKGDIDAKKTIKIGDGATLEYDATNECLKFIFS